MIKSFNNRTEKIGDDLKLILGSGSKIDIAAGIFSIYGYESLKAELNKIEKLRFIFTDPAFIETDKNRREHRQFQINAILREKAISGTQFEINLKNELKGKAIARECKKWIEQKVEFRTNLGNKYIQSHINLETNGNRYVYTGVNEFSSAGLGYEKDNSVLNQIIKTDDFETTKQYLNTFNEIWNDNDILQDVTDEVSVILLIYTKKILLNLSITLPSIIFLMNSWKTFPKMNWPMKRLALRNPLSGINFTISSVMRFLELSTS